MRNNFQNVALYGSIENVLSVETQIEAYVNEAYAETYINQLYTNNKNNPVELVIDLPNEKGVQFLDFEVEIKDKKVKSKVIEKEKAEEKYTDAIAEGNTAIYCEFKKEENKYVIHLGNIEAKAKVNFKSHFHQRILSNDLNYVFKLMNHFPFPRKSQYDNDYSYSKIDQEIIKLRVIFETSSPILALEQKVNGENQLIKSRFNEDKTRYEIEMEIKDKQDNAYRNYVLFGSPYSNYPYEDPKKYLPLVTLEFQIDGYDKPKLYRQYDPKNNETSFLLSYFKLRQNQADTQNNITRSFPGLYYFIIDQSGSMSGRPIKLVIQTLKVFMQSLSKGSYYQLIGFGSDFVKYSPKPLAYTRENVNETLRQIEGLKGNMGGTYLVCPMSYIYNCRKNDDLHLPQHIFILTDGYTEGAKDVLDLIEKNSSRYQVYAYGMGNDFDKEFIRTAGEIGYGSYKFINDIENLSVTINQQLQKCMREYYDKVNFNVEQNGNKLIYDFYRNEFILENQLVNYSFIMEGKVNGNINIKNRYNQGEKEFNDYFKFDENQILTLKDGNILSKITIHNLILKGQGDFSQEQNIKTIAKKYQVLCEYTSLFAEIENSNENQEGKMQQINITYSNDTNKYYNNKYSANTGSLFGNNNNTGSIFHNNTNNTLFGNNANLNAGGGLFGNNANSNTGGSLFGNNSNLNTGGGLFGNNSNPNTGGGLFGNNSNLNTGGGLFGNNSNPNTGGSLFGNNANVGESFFCRINNRNREGRNNDNNCQRKRSINRKNDLFEAKNVNDYIIKDNEQRGLSPPGKLDNQKSNSLFRCENDGCNNLFSYKKDECSNGHFINNNNQYNTTNLFGIVNNNNYESNLNDNNKENDNIENIIMSLDIIDGFWEENAYTKCIIEMKRDIYNKVISLVNDNKVAITFIILYYIMNDRKDKIDEYLNIINKAKTFLVNSGYSYENILSQIGFFP